MVWCLRCESDEPKPENRMAMYQDDLLLHSDNCISLCVYIFYESCSLCCKIEPGWKQYIYSIIFY